MNYITSVIRLMDICESELLFDTLPITKADRRYVKRVWMKHSVVEEYITDKYVRVEILVNGKCHRTDGNPAVVYVDSMCWYVNGKNHRVGGPANLYHNISNKTIWHKRWAMYGKRHRVGGPAAVYANSGKSWYINGKIHRVDGPANVHADDHKEWWINDQYVSKF